MMFYSPIAASVCIWIASSFAMPFSGEQPHPAEVHPVTMDATEQITILDNIPYREGDSEAWRLDLALPANNGRLRPAIVIIHGGGWRFGWKQDPIYRSMLVNYALKGYVTASVEYRLIDEGTFQNCIEDVKCAVRWLRIQSPESVVNRTTGAVAVER